ncbi:hypothetical protein HanPSC8_Chr07g0285831 [Helianthus annuus]|nr:hypothetical protein HanPSC8_Chr07g0285831 [Helianthus annuus]
MFDCGNLLVNYFGFYLIVQPLRFLNSMKHGDDILHRVPVAGTARGWKRVGDGLGTFPKRTRILGTGQKQVIL